MMKPVSSTRRRVLRLGLQLSPHLGIGREVVAGVLDYQRQSSGTLWELVWATSARGFEELQSANVDALLGTFDPRRDAKALRAWGRPTVNLCGSRARSAVPQVGTDDVRIGLLAGEHLADCGYPHFGFLGLRQHAVSDSRLKGFRQAVAARGRGVASLSWTRDYPAVVLPEGAYQRADGRIVRWIAQLPRPVAVLAVDDLRAWWVVEACRELGLGVPEDVGILGVGDDALVCEGLQPPVSSVRVPLRRCGELAAELLERLVLGRPVRDRVVRLAPEGITVRQSTNILALHDRDVAAALAFIRSRPDAGGSVDEVVVRTRVCRRVLENKFRRHLGRTPFQEMLRWRMEEAKRLLRETDWTLERIADATGFGAGVRLSAEFRRITGQTPGAYRRLARGRP